MEVSLQEYWEDKCEAYIDTPKKQIGTTERTCELGLLFTDKIVDENFSRS